MKKQRLTIEELRELKPSRTNMIELVCDDGHYYDHRASIMVYSVDGSVCHSIDNKDIHRVANAADLLHYPSFKEEPETVRVFTGRYVESDGYVSDYSATSLGKVEMVITTNARRQLGEITEEEYEVIND